MSRKFKMFCPVCDKVVLTETEEECPCCHTNELEEYEPEAFEVSVFDVFD